MADTGYNSGIKPKRPGQGKNGPNGSGGGTRHFKPKMPTPNSPRPAGTGGK